MKRSPMPPRKTPLKSKTGLKPGGYLKRKTRMPRTSKRREEKRRMDKVLQRDACGQTLLEAQNWLPKTNDWPDPGIVKKQDVIELFVSLHAMHTERGDEGQYRTWGRCWLCGKERWCDVAHIVADPGRSDELANLALLCSMRPEYGYQDSCHDLTEKNDDMLPRLLAAKLANDFEHTSFLRIAQLRKQKYKFSTLD